MEPPICKLAPEVELVVWPTHVLLPHANLEMDRNIVVDGALAPLYARFTAGYPIELASPHRANGEMQALLRSLPASCFVWPDDSTGASAYGPLATGVTLRVTWYSHAQAFGPHLYINRRRTEVDLSGSPNDDDDDYVPTHFIPECKPAERQQHCDPFPLDDVVGDPAKMAQVEDALRRMAALPLPVLTAEMTTPKHRRVVYRKVGGDVDLVMLDATANWIECKHQVDGKWQSLWKEPRTEATLDLALATLDYDAALEAVHISDLADISWGL
jgi:hypothetical protein